MEKSNIWDRTLSSNEVIKKEFSISNSYIKIGLIFWLIFGGILLLGGIGIFIIPIVLFYYLFYLKQANHYAFTNKRVLIIKGWLSTKLTSIDYDKITDITVLEPFLDRLIYKTGSLAINTAGTSLHEVVLQHIEDPYKIKQELDEIRDRGNKNKK